MELSKRLQAVADLLSPGLKVADIGCDHGFVSIYLVESGKASWCLAMDVNKGPLERAREHILNQRLSTYIETRLSDGAKAIQFVADEENREKLEVDAAIIAGMGGRLMIKIIQDSLDKFQAMQEFVLQPQSEIARVRQFIREIGFTIVAEDMVLEEGKFYPMMKAVKNGAVLVKQCCMDAGRDVFEEDGFDVGNGISDAKKDSSDVANLVEGNSSQSGIRECDFVEVQELFDNFGEYLLKKKHPVLYQFLGKEVAIYGRILASLMNQESEKSKARQAEIEQKLKLLHQGLEWFQE